MAHAGGALGLSAGSAPFDLPVLAEADERAPHPDANHMPHSGVSEAGAARHDAGPGLPPVRAEAGFAPTLVIAAGHPAPFAEAADAVALAQPVVSHRGTDADMMVMADTRGLHAGSQGGRTAQPAEAPAHQGHPQDQGGVGGVAPGTDPVIAPTMTVASYAAAALPAISTVTLTLRASRAADFLGSLGVNTHMGNPDMGYGDVGQVLKELAYLGITHIRDWFPEKVWPLQASQLGTLASAGIKLDALLPDISPVDLKSHMAALNAFALAHPGAISAVEGPNEIDAWPVTYGGLDGVAAVVALQKDLYAAVHGSAALAGVPVYSFTTGWLPPASYGIGDVSPYADFGNVHIYAPNGTRPADVLPEAIRSFSADVPGKPVVMTETNYYTLPLDSNWGGVDQDVQATYGLYTALDNWRDGVRSTFFYELHDEAGDLAREHNLGLFAADGTPKEFATALHNLTSILADSGRKAASFKTASVSVAFAGLPASASAQAMQKSDGTTDLLVWDEQQVWDPVNHVQLPATTSDVTVNLGKTFASVQVFDPLAGTLPIASYYSASQVSLHLSDHPLIIQMI